MRRRLHLALLLSLLGATFGIATGSADDARLRFSRLSVEDGLAQSSVVDILQDRLGFLWFATEEGLCRYDGQRFVTYRAGSAPGTLANSNITALAEDPRGDLWVGTSLGVHRLELATGRFTHAGGPSVARFSVRDVAVDAAGRVWFSGHGAGLYEITPGAEGDGPAVRVEGGPLDAEARVTALAVSGTTVWAAAGGSLLRIDGADPHAVTPTLGDLGDVSRLAVQANRVWIGRRDGDLIAFLPATGAVERYPHAPHDILALLPAGPSALWIGARDGGLSRLDVATGTVVTQRNDPGDLSTLSEDDVDALFLDRGGMLWIGTWNGGVSVLNPYGQAFRWFDHRPYFPGSLPDDDVTAITETPDGRVWTASRNGALAVGDPRSGRFQSVPRAAGSWGRMSALAHDGNELVIGGSRGLIALDASTARERPLAPALREAGLDHVGIDTLVIGPSGELWIASGRRIYEATRQARSTSAATVRALDPLPNDVAALGVTPSGRLWVGLADGAVLRLEPDDRGNALHPFTNPGGAAPLTVGAYVTTLDEDPHGRLWIGSRDGVVEVDLAKGTARRYGRTPAQASVSVAGLLESPDGFIWYATNQGLSRIDPERGDVVQFGSRDGAQGAGYVEGGYARGDSGLLYFAGHGLTVFDARDVALDPHRPEVVFTGFEIDHRPVLPRWRDPKSPLERELHSQGAITLAPDALVLSFEMAALHFGDPDSVRFAYRLEGFDGDWIETSADRANATYTRLAPGDYLLRARAATKNGLWSERDAALAIHVLPPWWRTAPALGLWTLLGLAAIVGAVLAVRRREAVRLALLEREALRRASLTDPLTGLYNRRFLEPYLEHELPGVLRAHETGRPAADLHFFLVDVDHFKAINDRSSHAVGDQVLIAVADALRREIRESDLAVRWGGDEFLVVSRSLDRRYGEQCAERLRRSVGAIAIPAGGGEQVRCTLSIGYAAFPFLAATPRALTWPQTLELADRALLRAKRDRRDCHLGLVAAADTDPALVLAYLAGDAWAAVPAGVTVVAGPPEA
jgi:diguanylate cyclase (GGDEF)-like protein